MPAARLEIQARFNQRKQRIIEQIAVPANSYTDLSPKGSIDEGIRQLIDDLNAQDGFVTTSSCAGRVSVFLEGQKYRPADSRDDEARLTSGGQIDKRETHDKTQPDEHSQQYASIGGKGGGGRWLYVSHEPRDQETTSYTKLFGLSRTGSESKTVFSKDARYVHFKFEPMILHILTASVRHAQVVLKAAVGAGFRESGAINISHATGEAPMPMVAVRCQGLSLDSIIGYLPGTGQDEHSEPEGLVGEEYLRIMMNMASERFADNTRRVEDFRSRFLQLCDSDPLLLSPAVEIQSHPKLSSTREDAESRRARRRAEGLAQNRARHDAQDTQVSSHRDSDAQAEDIETVLQDVGFLV